jgi:hypothetical protein
MEVVGRGSAAPWPIIQDRPVAAKITRETKENIYMLNDGLWLMYDVGDGEMTGKHRHGITENKELLMVEDPFLVFWQAVEAEKAGPFVYAVISHICQGAPDSSGVMLNTD